MGSPIRALQEQCAFIIATNTEACGYREWAKQQGFSFLEILDWTSSSGDWSFIVSRNGKQWYLMFQESNFLQPGLTRMVDTSRYWTGTVEKVIKKICKEVVL